MSYKRFKRYGRKSSTNVIRMKFQSFMDISTSSDSMQIITISAGGHEILKRLAPQFGAYKYYKIGAISAKLVPASTLPVDPTGLSYEAGENTVDPRDQLTPGMMRITNGEDVFEDISGLSDDVQHAIYNNMLLDPRWFKWMLQSGTSRRAYPRYWQVGQLHQDKWPGAFINMPFMSGNNSSAIAGTINTSQSVQADSGRGVDTNFSVGSSPYGFFQTGHRGVLGWLPTDGLQTVAYHNGDLNALEEVPLIASPPEVEVMKIILPKAYKTKYFYRLFITEEVLFREPIVNFGLDVNGNSYRPIDVFHSRPNFGPIKPSLADLTNPFPDTATGGNYGND